MLKAMLLVTILGGGVDYTDQAWFRAEMPSMEKCLDARTAIAKQDPAVKTLCIPMVDDFAAKFLTRSDTSDMLKIQELFDIFVAMIDQRNKEESQINCDEKSNLDQFLNQLMKTPTTCPQNDPLLRN